mgnify:CR=1 FL=1
MGHDSIHTRATACKVRFIKKSTNLHSRKNFCISNCTSTALVFRYSLAHISMSAQSFQSLLNKSPPLLPPHQPRWIIGSQRFPRYSRRYVFSVLAPALKYSSATHLTAFERLSGGQDSETPPLLSNAFLTTCLANLMVDYTHHTLEHTF